ncbi:MAG: GntR family transcriptional regulator [Butyricicoccus pullicaecorum]|nr:GntR family transcriptional regulator [Butyricicoccus pullicaecorum]
MFGINYRDGRPIYEQIVDEIEQMVVHDVLQPDSQLPSVRQMAAELSINPNTIQRAYSELESRGVIYSVKGKGNFVSPSGTVLRERRMEDIRTQLLRLLQTAKEIGIDGSLFIKWIEEEGRKNV